MRNTFLTFQGPCGEGPRPRISLAQLGDNLLALAHWSSVASMLQVRSNAPRKECRCLAVRASSSGGLMVEENAVAGKPEEFVEGHWRSDAINL